MKATKKEWITTENINKIADFLKESAEQFESGFEGCCRYPLNDDLAIYVGWAPHDGDCPEIIKSTDNQWSVDAAVKVRNDFYWAEYDGLSYPYDEQTGDVWDSSLSLMKNMNRREYKRMARWLLSEFVGIVKEFNRNPNFKL